MDVASTKEKKVLNELNEPLRFEIKLLLILHAISSHADLLLSRSGCYECIIVVTAICLISGACINRILLRCGWCNDV